MARKAKCIRPRKATRAPYRIGKSLYWEAASAPKSKKKSAFMCANARKFAIFAAALAGSNWPLVSTMAAPHRVTALRSAFKHFGPGHGRPKITNDYPRQHAILRRWRGALAVARYPH